jgi:hypothetical protein
MSLQQSFLAMLIPSSDPSVSAGAIHLQTVSDLTGGLPLDTQHDGLEPQGDAGCFVGLGFLAKSLKPQEGTGIASREDGLHDRKKDVVLLIRTSVQHVSAPLGKQKGHLRSAKPFFKNSSWPMMRAFW